MRKSVRSVIGARVSRSCRPTASSHASLPCRATAATAPAILRSATYRASSAPASPSFAGARPDRFRRGARKGFWVCGERQNGGSGGKGPAKAGRHVHHGGDEDDTSWRRRGRYVIAETRTIHHRRDEDE